MDTVSPLKRQKFLISHLKPHAEMLDEVHHSPDSQRPPNFTSSPYWKGNNNKNSTNN